MAGSGQMEIPFAWSLPPEELRRRARELTADLVRRARERWPDAEIPEPRIHLGLRGRTAGDACPETNTTRYNRELLERHGEEFLREIVPHEVAHLVAARVFPRARRPHGPEWKAVMAFFGVPARTTHRFESLPVPERGRYRYRCECPRPHWLTRRSHRKAQRGSVEYSCRECGRPLVRVVAPSRR